MPRHRRSVLPPRPRPFSDQHSTMTNIDWRPDLQNGMGNAGFQDALYRPDQDAQAQCAPMGGFGGFFGGILGGLLGQEPDGAGGMCAPVPAPTLSPQPDTMWI
jgi:hypothetical protein